MLGGAALAVTSFRSLKEILNFLKRMTAWLDSLGQSQQLMQNDIKSFLFAFRKTFQGFKFSFKPDQVIGLRTFFVPSVSENLQEGKFFLL